MKALKNLVLKSLKLNKRRSIVTIVGIILSVALICAVSSMYFSSLSSLTSYEKIMTGDYHVEFKNVPKDKISTFKLNRNIENVDLVDNIGYSYINSKNDYKPYVYVKGMGSKGLKDLTKNVIKGRMPRKDGEILIPSHLENNGMVKLKVGYTITLNIGTRVDGDGNDLDQDIPYSFENNEKIINTKEKSYKIVGLIDRPDSSMESYEAPGYTLITYENDIRVMPMYM